VEGKSSKPQSRVRSKYRYIVHHERKFVYFFVHKVASSGIKTALLPLFDLDEEDPRFWRSGPDGARVLLVHRLFSTSGHSIDKERLLEGLDHEYRDYFKFAFVRNPWDRLLSCYFDKTVREATPPLQVPVNAAVELYSNMPFAEFVEAVCRIPDKKADRHFRSQHPTVYSPDGRLMADFVGRFETLQEDFARVAGEIGAPGLQLPERNQTYSSKRGSRHYRDFYDDRLKKLVHQRYVYDVEAFGYSF
jgi:hypothetical protein